MNRICQVRSFRLLLTLIGVCLLASVGLSQNPPPASSPQPSPHPATSPAEKSTDKTPVAKNEKGSEAELLALRDEIGAASNEQERLRLQFKVVDSLVVAGKKREAMAELNSMSAVDRFDPQGFYNIANAQARLGDSEVAVSTYRKAIDQRKGRYSRALNNLGVVLMRLGRWDEAYDSFLSALRLESFRYAEASYNLGRLYSARGELDLAIREWRRALAVDPEHTAASGALARSGSMGNIRVASVPASRPVTNINKNRAAGRPEKERAISSAAPAKAKRSEPAAAFTVDREAYTFLQRARVARDRNRNEEAVENYRRVLAGMGGYFAPANLELSYALVSLKRNDEAIAMLQPVVVKDGARLPIAFYHLARLYEQKGDLKLAEENFSRAAESYGEGNAQFLLDLSRVREKLGNLSGALASLEQYVTSMERQGQKPDWSDERLAALKQKVAASPASSKP